MFAVSAKTCLVCTIKLSKENKILKIKIMHANKEKYKSFNPAGKQVSYQLNLYTILIASREIL